MLEEKFKLSCFEGNLSCLSKKYNTPYNIVWDEIKNQFGITCFSGNDECCLGIGEMVIDDSDDCKAFIIGGCSENEQEEIIEGGAFSPCGFQITGFQKALNNQLPQTGASV